MNLSPLGTFMVLMKVKFWALLNLIVLGIVFIGYNIQAVEKSAT